MVRLEFQGKEIAVFGPGPLVRGSPVCPLVRFRLHAFFLHHQRQDRELELFVFLRMI